MHVVTVIPARGGSKSIPLKNIRMLGERPLIDYTIQYSLRSKVIAHTVVSTDSAAIAKIAKESGAEVPFLRPDEFAQDLTPDFPVIEHALKELEQLYATQIDAIVLLRPTSPLRIPGLIERAVELLEGSPDATSVRAVMKSEEHPFRQWKMKNGFIAGYESEVSEPYNLPRQLLPEVYFQTGDIEVVRRSTILSGSVSGENVLPLILDREDVLDIDYFSDLAKAKEVLDARSDSGTDSGNG